MNADGFSVVFVTECGVVVEDTPDPDVGIAFDDWLTLPVCGAEAARLLRGVVESVPLCDVVEVVFFSLKAAYVELVTD